MSWKIFGWKLINNRISPYLKLTSWLSGACEGDSGSPVIRRISVSGRGRPFYQQDFIVSTGLDCRLRATIYIRVSQRKVLHWIQKISGTQPVVMVVGGFSSHSKEFLQAKAKVITYILTKVSRKIQSQLLCAVLMNWEVGCAIIAQRVKIAFQPLLSSIRANWEFSSNSGLTV